MGIAQTFLKVLILGLVCFEAFKTTFGLWMHAFESNAQPQTALVDGSALAFYSQADYFCVTVGDRMDGSLGDTYSSLRVLSPDEYQHFAFESLKRSDCRGAALYGMECVLVGLQRCGPLREPVVGILVTVTQTVETTNRFAKAMPVLIEDTIHPRTYPRTTRVEVRPDQWLTVDTP